MARSAVQIERVIKGILERQGSWTEEAIVKAVQAPAGQVADVLRRSPTFRRVGQGWALSRNAPRSRSIGRARAKHLTVRLPAPYDWQAEALLAWRDQDRKGIVEAVTGAGKTNVAMHAMVQALQDGGQVLVIVPTVALQSQWLNSSHKAFPGVRIGRIGGQHQDQLDNNDILIGVVNTVRSSTLKTRDPLLLVADEVHRYGTKMNAGALEERFPRRLGLSATYERDDSGVDDHLAPYFGSICYRIGYRRAIADGVLARYRIALIGADLTPRERYEYEELSSTISSAGNALSEHIGFSEPFSDFMKEVEELAKDGRGAAGHAARQYLKSVNARRGLLALSPSRDVALARLIPVIRESQRSLIFAERILQCSAIERMLAAADIRVGELHSDLKQRDRDAVLRRFAKGEITTVVAPRVLDEGVDVPEADLGVVVSTTRSRRQMIQRMGRVLRVKSDGRHARFVLIYMSGTIEDPANGAHERFLGAWV